MFISARVQIPERVILPFAHTKQGVFIQETTVLGDIVHTLKVPTQASLGSITCVKAPLFTLNTSDIVQTDGKHNVSNIKVGLDMLNDPPIKDKLGRENIS